MAFFILPLLSARELDIGPEGFSSRDDIRGFKVFYNRRYFLNFRRYLKN